MSLQQNEFDLYLQKLIIQLEPLKIISSMMFNIDYDSQFPQIPFEGYKNEFSPSFSNEFQNDQYPIEDQQEVIYSPFQQFMNKQLEVVSDLEEFNTQRALENGKSKPFNGKRKISIQFEKQLQKKVCFENRKEEGDKYLQRIGPNSGDDLEKLVDDIKLEFKQYTQESEQEEMFIYKPSYDQELFLKSYVSENAIKQFQKDVNLDLVKDEETQNFVNWVENLCVEKNNISLKEVQRKQKVKKYLEKKRNRTYEKKVHYHMRQKVAEERLRIKGKFVTWSKVIIIFKYQIRPFIFLIKLVKSPKTQTIDRFVVWFKKNLEVQKVQEIRNE